MSVFRGFEAEAVRLLLAELLPEDEVTSLLESAEPVSNDRSDSGYFVTVRHPSLPEAKIIRSKPTVVGRAGEIQAGFVVFLENHELTLECHCWGGVDVPEDFRDREVEISIAT